jgi:hypothetical protein
MEQILKDRKKLLYKLQNSNPNTGDYDEVRTLSINIERVKRDIKSLKRNIRTRKIKKLFRD